MSAKGLGKVHLGYSNEKETFQIPEKEYRAYEAIAKKTGFKNVEELVNTAIVLFFLEDSGLSVQPKKAKQFTKYFLEEIAKKPKLDIKELFRTFSLQH